MAVCTMCYSPRPKTTVCMPLTPTVMAGGLRCGRGCLLQPGETPMTDGPIQPYQGITSTPVIDTSSNTVYVVSAQTLTSTGASTFRLNALDITTGKQKFGGPATIQASVPGTNSTAINGVVSLETSCIQRADLLRANSTLGRASGRERV